MEITMNDESLRECFKVIFWFLSKHHYSASAPIDELQEMEEALYRMRNIFYGKTAIVKPPGKLPGEEPTAPGRITLDADASGPYTLPDEASFSTDD